MMASPILGDTKNDYFHTFAPICTRFNPLGLQPPPDLEAAAPPLDLEVHNHIADWAKIMVTFLLEIKMCNYIN
jgi:hypothetical protein